MDFYSFQKKGPNMHVAPKKPKCIRIEHSMSACKCCSHFWSDEVSKSSVSHQQYRISINSDIQLLENFPASERLHYYHASDMKRLKIVFVSCEGHHDDIRRNCYNSAIQRHKRPDTERIFLRTGKYIQSGKLAILAWISATASLPPSPSSDFDQMACQWEACHQLQR